MINIKTIAAAVITISCLANPAFAFGIKTFDNIQIDTSVTNLRNVALPAAIRGKGCTFYEHDNGRGEAWHKSVGWLANSYSNQDSYAEYVTYTGEWWNDRISSLKCDDSSRVRCSVGLYEHTNKGGREIILWGGQGLVNLSQYGFNDTISSFMIFCNLMK
ncbi:hypothetical protein [Devosia sp. 2618]|uniref:hypothetical protein n=1 Tax=Devosia sp. 2618 TaxID=3156454 RepID=UPI003397ADED